MREGGPPIGRDDRFRLLVDGIVDYAVFLVDPEGRIAIWNRGALDSLWNRGVRRWLAAAGRVDRRSSSRSSLFMAIPS